MRSTGFVSIVTISEHISPSGASAILVTAPLFSYLLGKKYKRSSAVFIPSETNIAALALPIPFKSVIGVSLCNVFPFSYSDNAL